MADGASLDPGAAQGPCSEREGDHGEYHEEECLDSGMNISASEPWSSHTEDEDERDRERDNGLGPNCSQVLQSDTGAEYLRDDLVRIWCDSHLQFGQARWPAATQSW